MIINNKSYIVIEITPSKRRFFMPIFKYQKEVKQNGKKAYSVKEVMKLTGLSRNLTYELIHTGKLKAVRAGEKRIIIPAWSLDEFLKQAN